jgi:HD superfamily phosphodiesterase
MDKDRYKSLNETVCEILKYYSNYWFFHLRETAMLCRLIAIKRSLDDEVCRCAGLLHDLWLAQQSFPLEIGLHGKHGYVGSDIARDMLKQNGGYSDKEIGIICEMIYNHNDKDIAHDEYSEALKDADVLQHYLNADEWYGNKRLERAEKVAKEL